MKLDDDKNAIYKYTYLHRSIKTEWCIVTSAYIYIYTYIDIYVYMYEYIYIYIYMCTYEMSF